MYKMYGLIMSRNSILINQALCQYTNELVSILIRHHVSILTGTGSSALNYPQPTREHSNHTPKIIQRSELPGKQVETDHLTTKGIIITTVPNNSQATI